VPDAAAHYLSPLRYPGGKGRLAPFVGDLLAAQPRAYARYVEPFAGGAGVALRLLVDEHVEEIVLNDLNRGIAAFWRSVFDHTGELLRRLRTCKVTVAEWRRQREAYERDDCDLVERGFATFFLNRTNRSGILDARPIGGLDQTGKWKIDARFDRDILGTRIRTLASYSSRVTICECDGVDLVESFRADNASFIYADPPYLTHGDDLYLDTLEWEDHMRLARVLRDADGWLVTYDADPRIATQLYPELRCAEFQTSHTAAVQHVGREYAVFSDSLRLPPLHNLGSHSAKLLS
jgi:DNA adenine methylase